MTTTSHGSGTGTLTTPSDEAHALLPGLDHVAGADPGDAPLAVEADVDDEIAAGHLGDARVLLVDGIAFQEAAVGRGCSRNCGPCQTLTVSRAAMPGQMTLRPPL